MHPAAARRPVPAGGSRPRAGILLPLLVLLAVALARPAAALVRMDEGRRQIKGIQLLQDYSDPKTYYYVPSYPRLATSEDGSFQFLCLKYQDIKGKSAGGLFHALVEFTLPPDFVTEVEKELQKQVPGARLAGPVPLLQSGAAEGADSPGSFEIVSAILKNSGEGGLTRQLVSSGKAPVTPGSRAAVAALLTQEGADLLWASLTSSTSDVSVGINAYYEAAVTAFDARVTAEMSVLYDHFSKLDNRQQGFTKRQVRDIVDELRRKGDIKVEVLDRSRALDLPNAGMQGLVDSVTSKLTELMFDSKTGLSADPPQEVAVEKGQVKDRQSRGFLTRLFAGSGNQAYYSDDQLVLKRRSDIRRNVFSVVLTKNATVKVPVHTAGNLRGLYETTKADPRYFRIVTLNRDFERRPVYFQVDGEYVAGFQDAINFVAINIRKKYTDAANPDYAETLRFGQEAVKGGQLLIEANYPRLGEPDENFLKYEYQVVWSFRGRDSVRVPADPNKWITTTEPAVSLTPPLDKQVVDIDADRGAFADKGVASVNVIFDYPLLGRPKQTRATLRAADTAPTSTVTLFVDRQAPVKARVTWYFKDGRQVVKEMPVSGYMSLVPPGE
jgi:hypothetical protein